MAVLLSGNFFRNTPGLTVAGATFDAASNTLTIIDTANNFATDAAAATGGVPIGGLYHNAGAVRVRLA